MAVVDYHSLTRKELQTLCKKHGIPANKKNSFMADALTSILKVDKPDEFGSATPTNFPVGNNSITSTLKIQNNRGDLTASKVPYGSTFCSLEIQSQRKEPIEEDAISSTLDTHTDDFTGEKSKREKAKIDDSDTTKTSEAEQDLLHVPSTGTDDRKEVYHHANQQTEPAPDTPIALYEDVLEELCQQAKFVSRKGDEYSLCCTSNSSLCKDVNDRLDNDTITYTHDWKTTVDVRRVDHLGQEELCQQAKFVARKGDEYSLCCTSISSLCKDVNDRLDHDTKIYTHDEQTTVDMQRVDHLGQEKQCQQDKDATRNADEESLNCMSSFSPCLVVNTDDTHEDINSPDHEEKPIHVEGVDFLCQEKEIYMKDHEETDIDPALSLFCERLQNHIDNDKEKNSQGHIDIDAKEMVIDDETVKHDQPCNQPPFCRGNDKENNSQRHINADDRKDLFAKEMVIYDETVKHDQPCNQPPSCRGNDQVKKSMVNIQTAEVSNKPSSFQFFVSCDNGIKLFVDPENSSSSEWMKSHNYEFSFCQELDELKHCEHSDLKSASCPTICKVDVTEENRKVKSDKLTDFQPLTSYFERFSDQNSTTCSSKFPRSQNFCSILPFAFAKKSDVSKELRRTSSFLIPPHGANRGLAPFMTKKSSRFSSTLMSPKNTINVSFYPAAIGNPHKSVSTQANCSSENSWPIKAAPSKIQNLPIKLGTPRKELSLAKYHPNTKTAYPINEPATPYAFVEAVSVMTPIKDGCQDVKMLDQDLHNYSTKSPQRKTDNEHDFHLAEDYQISDKKVESVSQMNSPHNSQKQMHKKTLLEDLQVEENRIISRYKDEYKKSPFTKCLRGIKNLARAATIRADILARRRGLPLVGNSSGFHNLPYQSQNVQGKESQDEILRVESGNENGASPQVYRETELSVSSIKREREDPVIVPSVYGERYLSVSHLTPGKDPMHDFCNIAMPLAHNGPVITSTSTEITRDAALQSSTIIIESNPKLSERQYSQISSLAHQEKLTSSVYGLIPGKDFLQNIGNISAPSALAELVMAHVSKGVDREEERQNNTSSEYNPKLPGRFLQPLAKMRFFEKALAESTERTQAHRKQQNDVNHLSGQMIFSDNVPNTRSNTDYLLSLNLVNSCILEAEDGPTENQKVSESQTRQQELLKTPLRGKSKEKEMEVAKNKAFVELNENDIRNNTGNSLDLSWINSHILETEDGHNKRVSGRQKRYQEQFKTSLRWNYKEKAVKVANEMAFVQRNEIINLKRGITTVN